MKLVLKKISDRARCWLGSVKRSSGLALIVTGFIVGLSPTSIAQTEPFVVADIRVEGLQRIAPGSVFAALPVSVGDVVDELAIRSISRNLFYTGNFDDISVGRDGNVLVLTVAERPSI